MKVFDNMAIPNKNNQELGINERRMKDNQKYGDNSKCRRD
jgi:hypothetical protein